MSYDWKPAYLTTKCLSINYFGAAPFFNEERVFRTIRRQSILGIYVILATLYVPPYRQQSSGRFVPLIFASFAYEIGLIVTLLKISVDYTAH